MKKDYQISVGLLIAVSLCALYTLRYRFKADYPGLVIGDNVKKIAPLHDKQCKKFTCVFRNRSLNLPDTSITAVTEFFDIGPFLKDVVMRDSRTYARWVDTYGKFLTDVMFYTDSQKFASLMLEIRNGENQSTCVCLLDSQNLWSFGLIPKIQRIFDIQKYPKNYPNNVIPAYGAAMHAKYELMNWAVTENLFNTEYFVWSDLGVFQALMDKQKFDKIRPFTLAIPEGFNKSQVAYTQVNPPNFQLHYDRYFRERGHVWVCGCFFVAERNVMLNWTLEYRRFVELLIEYNSSSTDQQVLYAMYNVKFANVSPNISIQTYQPRSERLLKWFYLAYLSRHRGLKLQYSPGHSLVASQISSNASTGSLTQSKQSPTLPLPLDVSDGKQPLYNEYR